jgi:hypothetical protein
MAATKTKTTSKGTKAGLVSRAVVEQERREMALLMSQRVEDIPIEQSLAYMERGLFVDLHIGRARATEAMTLEDLGIYIQDANQRAQMTRVMSLGTKFLWPRALLTKLDGIDNKARECLKRYAMTLPRGGRSTGSFVPMTRLRDMWRDLMDLTNPQSWRSQYFALRDEMLSLQGYEQNVAQVLADHEKLAGDAWVRLGKLSPKVRSALTHKTQAEFVDAYLARVQGRIPRRQSFYDSFYFGVDLAFNSLPHLLAEERAEAERIDAARRVERVDEEARLTAARGRLDAERRAVSAYERDLDFMNKLLLEQVQQDKEQMVKEWWNEVIGALAQTAYDTAVDVLTKAYQAEPDKPFQGPWIKQLTNMVETVQGMNFVDWQDMERAMAVVKSYLAPRASKRDYNALLGALENVATLARAEMWNMGRPLDPIPDDLSIPEFPDNSDVMVARDRLSLDDDDFAAVWTAEQEVLRVDLVEMPPDPGRAKRVTASVTVL